MHGGMGEGMRRRGGTAVDAGVLRAGKRCTEGGRWMQGEGSCGVGGVGWVGLGGCGRRETWLLGEFPINAPKRLPPREPFARRRQQQQGHTSAHAASARPRGPASQGWRGLRCPGCNEDPKVPTSPLPAALHTGELPPPPPPPPPQQRTLRRHTTYTPTCSRRSSTRTHKGGGGPSTHPLTRDTGWGGENEGKVFGMEQQGNREGKGKISRPRGPRP